MPKHPWDRQSRGEKSETTPAFEAFQTYLDMGPHRSLRAVARELGKSETLIARWSARWSWSARAQAWEDQVAERKREAHARELERISRRHAKLAGRLLDEVEAEITTREALRKQYEEARKEAEAEGAPLGAEPPEPLTGTQLASLFKAGVDVQRLASGLATEKIEAQVSTSLGASLSRIVSDDIDGDDA